MLVDWKLKADNEVFTSGIVTSSVIAKQILRFLIDPTAMQNELNRAQEAEKRRNSRPITKEETEEKQRFDRGYYDGGPGGPVKPKW